MALRLKTVEFPFVTLTTPLTAATRNDFTAITLDIPENSSRTFRSVYVEVNLYDNNTTSTSMTSRLIGIKLGAVAFNDESISDFVQDSGARQHFRFTRDVTSYFTTNFGSGTSQTCQVGVQFGGIAAQSISVKIYCTYEYDDTSQTTQVKTVKIPIESNTGLLSATLAEAGTNQIPNLSTFLPEASISYKQIWFELAASESNGGVTTDFNLAVALDAEAEVSMGLLEMQKNNSTDFWVIWVRNDMSTSATHALKARATTANRMGNFGGNLCVTYTYNSSTSTRILNSLSLPFPQAAASIKSGDSSTDAYRTQYQFFIEEPGTITLLQSGVTFRITQGEVNSATHYNIRVGSQSFRDYTFTASSNSGDAGPCNIHHRIDSGGASGAGITLARGLNTITLDFYHSTSGVSGVTNDNALATINYTSDKHSSGVGVHNKTIRWLLQRSQITSNKTFEISAVAPIIPETNYYINCAGSRYIHLQSLNSGGSIKNNYAAEMKSGEKFGDGWEDLYCGSTNLAFVSSNESWVCTADRYTRYPTDPDTNRLVFSTSRKYRFYTNRTSNMEECIGSLEMIFTYHSQTYTVGGSVIGYSGAGSGIIINIQRSDTEELIGAVTTATGGTYTFTWYDNTINVYAHAFQDATHKGRSIETVAV